VDGLGSGVPHARSCPGARVDAHRSIHREPAPSDGGGRRSDLVRAGPIGSRPPGPLPMRSQVL
jgi:hypothetical protein